MVGYCKWFGLQIGLKFNVVTLINIAIIIRGAFCENTVFIGNATLFIPNIRRFET